MLYNILKFGIWGFYLIKIWFTLPLRCVFSYFFFLFFFGGGFRVFGLIHYKRARKGGWEDTKIHDSLAAMTSITLWRSHLT